MQNYENYNLNQNPMNFTNSPYKKMSQGYNKIPGYQLPLEYANSHAFPEERYSFLLGKRNPYQLHEDLEIEKGKRGSSFQEFHKTGLFRIPIQ